MVEHYLQLLGTGRHVAPFERAIREAVRPDDVVVDLGCGVGCYAIFAARAGARRVFAVESAAAIEHAREMARRNGAAVEFLHGHSDEVELPEKATLLIFEDFSTDLLSGAQSAALDSARRRWLAEGGRMLPESVSLHACPIGSVRVRDSVNPFGPKRELPFALDCTALIEAAQNTPLYVHWLEDAVLLGPTRELLRQRTDQPLPRTAELEGELPITRAADLHGLCVWSELQLGPGETYSNRPDAPATWGQLVFPVTGTWTAPAGSRLRYQLGFHALFDDGLWKWSLELVDAAGASLQRMTGDSFAGTPIRAGSLRGPGPDEKVVLNARAALEAQVLALADGSRTVAEIIRALEERRTDLTPERAQEVVLRALADRRSPLSPAPSRQ